MNEYNFRNANKQEEEKYRDFLVEERNLMPDEAEYTVDIAHIGVLEPFQGTSPSYVGKVLIVFHQNVTMYEVFTYSEENGLTEVEQE